MFDYRELRTTPTQFPIPSYSIVYDIDAVSETPPTLGDVLSFFTAEEVVPLWDMQQALWISTTPYTEQSYNIMKDREDCLKVVLQMHHLQILPQTTSIEPPLIRKKCEL